MKDLDENANASRALFERASGRLDLATANRLRLARRAALADSAAPPARSRAWPSALAAAAMLVLGLAWWLPQRPSTPAATPATATAVVDEALLVAEGEEVELYSWLAEAPVAAEAEPEQAL